MFGDINNCVETHQCRWVECLTEWGQVMHISIIKLTTIGSGNGLLPGGGGGGGGGGGPSHYLNQSSNNVKTAFGNRIQ